MSRLILQTNVKLDGTKKFSLGSRTFKVNEEIYRISELQAKRFANKWKADYIQITNCDYLPDKHPIYQRFKMYEFDYDQILYLDMDAIVLPNCPDIFSRYKDSHFCAVRDNPWDKNTVKIAAWRNYLINLLGAKPSYRPFCDGVMLLNRTFIEKTKDFWRNHLYSYDKEQHDQTIFNKLIVDHFDGEYVELDESWGAWYRKGLYIDHLAAIRRINLDMDKYLKKVGIHLEETNSFSKLAL